MRILPAIAVLGCCAALLSPSQATAQDVITSITQQQFVAAMQNAGFKAELVQGKSTTAVRVDMVNGKVRPLVFFYDCNVMGCGSYTFVVWDTSKKLKLSFANAWNAARRYAKASIDKDGDFSFDYDVSIEDGVTLATITHSAKRFEAQLVSLASFDPNN